MKIKLYIKKIKDVNLPKYAHHGDAGMDLYAAEDVKLAPMERKIVPTGIQMAIPDGNVGLVWDRSGLAAKHSLHCLAGVIDSGYRGEIGVVIINLGKEEFVVEKNTRVAQMLIQPVVSAEIEEVEDLDDTKRGEGGFGSTGHK